MSIAHAALAVVGLTAFVHAQAGVVDPDCTPEKAAKGAATKAAVGVGGRCGVGETAKDTAKRKAGVEEKGPIEKHKAKNETPAEKVKKAVN